VRLAALLLQALSLVLAQGAGAGVNVWTSNGPESGSIISLALDMQTGALYAGTASVSTTGGGVFISTDRGLSWHLRNIGLPDAPVSQVTIDSQTSSTVYVVAGGHLFESTDAGGTWSKPGFPVDGLPEVFIVQVIALDPLTPATIYAGTQVGVFKSIDGGVHWTDTNLPGFPSVAALAIDPLTPTTLYVATNEQGAGVFKSTDGGGTWRVSNLGLADTAITSLAIDPRTTTTLYAGNEGYLGGVFKSTDGGTNWIASSDGLGFTGPGYALPVAVVTIDPMTPCILYAGTRFGEPGSVFKSTNGGMSWSASNTGLPPNKVSALLIDPHLPSQLYAGTSFPTGVVDGPRNGVFLSADSGASWTALSSGLTAAQVNAVTIDAHVSSTLYAGTQDGVFKTTDSGSSWAAMSNGLPYVFDEGQRSLVPTVMALVSDPLDPNTLYAGTLQRAFMSTDGAASWNADGLPNVSVTILAIDPLTPSTIYAGGAEDLYKSTDRGTTWVPTFHSEVGLTSMVIDPKVPATLYLSAMHITSPPGGVFKSIDGGMHWNLSGLVGDEVQALAIDPQTPSTLYAAGILGVSKSVDAGVTWHDFHSGLPDFNMAPLSALAIDPQTPTTIYAGTGGHVHTMTGAGVFESLDGGETWNAINTGLSDLRINTLAVDPVAPSTVYAGTVGGGVFAIEAPVACLGDCNHDGVLTNEDLLTMMNIALGNLDASSCMGAASAPAGAVTVVQILRAVTNSPCSEHAGA